MSGELDRQEATLRKLTAATREEAGAQRELATSAEKAAGAQQKMAESGEKVATSGRNSGRSLMELGRIVQDFQGGGLMGISNNMEGLALALGLGGGVAGVATLATVALTALQKPLEKLFESLTGGDEATRREAAAIKSLTEE